MNQPFRDSLYARVSSQRQADEATIQSQLFDIDTRLNRENLSIPESYRFIDDGYSGETLVRPDLERLRDCVSSSMIDRIFIHSPDRLARAFAHQAILLEEFSQYAVEVVFLNEEGLPNTPERRLLTQMQGMIAEYEREKILERTRRGRRYAAIAGRMSVFAGAPYGYHYISKHQGDGVARWEVNPEESEHVRLMFEMVSQRRATLSAVCREFEKRGIRTRTGKARWDRATIRGILINPAYFGEARFGKQHLEPRKPGKKSRKGDPVVPRRAKVPVATDAQDQILIPVPAIVSRSQFEEVGKRMDENRRQQRSRQQGTKYLLSGLLICGECGSAFCGRGLSNGRYVYYGCIGTDKYRYGGQTICHNGSVKCRELDLVVWEEVCQLLRDPQRLASELSRRQVQSVDKSQAVSKLEREVKQLRERLDRLIDAYTAGLLEKPEFEQRIHPLRERHARESSALSSLLGTLDNTDVETAAENLQRLAESVESQLGLASDQLKRDLFELLIKRIEIHASEIRIVYKVSSRPFVRSPEDRDFLQHCLWRQIIAPGDRRELQASQA